MIGAEPMSSLISSLPAGDTQSWTNSALAVFVVVSTTPACCMLWRVTSSWHRERLGRSELQRGG